MALAIKPCFREKLSDTLRVEGFSLKLPLPHQCPCKQSSTTLNRHGDLLKSLAVCPPQIVFLDAQQPAVE